MDSPSHRRIKWVDINRLAPQLHLDGVGRTALTTGLRSVGFERRVSKRKGFSKDPNVIRERFDFASEAAH